jgi:hypothetical protein
MFKIFYVHISLTNYTLDHGNKWESECTDPHIIHLDTGWK